MMFVSNKYYIKYKGLQILTRQILLNHVFQTFALLEIVSRDVEVG